VTAILTALLPLVCALAAAFGIGALWKRLTPAMSWQRLLRWIVVPVAFFVLFFVFGAIAVALVSGDVVHTIVVDGSRGPVIWQENTIVIFDDEGDTIERKRFDIRDVESGRRVQRVDYVQWWIVPAEVVMLGEGRDFVWLYSRRDGLHTRDAYDGHWLHGQRELLGGATISGREALDYDSSTRGLFVKTSAGKQFLDPTTLTLSKQPSAPSPNRFAAYAERDATGNLHNGYRIVAASVAAQFPHTRFIAHDGSLSRVEDGGLVRWTQQGVVDSTRIDLDYAFTRNGRLCIVQDHRLACFAIDTGHVQWLIR
jgi:hypothetical protein